MKPGALQDGEFRGRRRSQKSRSQASTNKWEGTPGKVRPGKREGVSNATGGSGKMSTES